MRRLRAASLSIGFMTGLTSAALIVRYEYGIFQTAMVFVAIGCLYNGLRLKSWE